MLTATITFGATAEGVPVLAAVTALGEQLAADTRWNARNPLIRPEGVPGPWKHLVFGHPARCDGSVDYGAYIFCVLEQFCRHLETAGDLRRGLHQVPQPAGTRSLAQALLTAGAATGGSANLLGQIIGAGTERTTSAVDGKQRDDEDDSTRQ